MKTIYLILIFLILGILFGLIFARLMTWISEYILKRKITNEINKGNEKREFFYKDKPYNLKESVEFEKGKRKKFHLFKRKMKGGISDYGNTLQSGYRGNEVLGSVKTAEYTANPTPSYPTNPPIGNIRKQEYPNPPESRGEQRGSINRNLLKKGKKFD